MIGNVNVVSAAVEDVEEVIQLFRNGVILSSVVCDTPCMGDPLGGGLDVSCIKLFKSILFGLLALTVFIYFIIIVFVSEIEEVYLGL